MVDPSATTVVVVVVARVPLLLAAVGRRAVRYGAVARAAPAGVPVARTRDRSDSTGSAGPADTSAPFGFEGLKSLLVLNLCPVQC